MKNHLLFLACIFTLISFVPQASAAESVCSIDLFTANYQDNSCEGEIITIEFEFDATDFGANGFELSFFGGTQSYNIGDPYELFVVVECTDDIELTITDVDDPNCSETITLGPACCDCEVTPLVYETSACNENGFFDLYIQDFIEGGTCLLYDWDVVIEGVIYDVIWNNVTQQFEVLDIESGLDIVEFSICSTSPLGECYDYEVENPCTLVCEIFSFTANYISNSCDGEIIGIEFDIDASNFGENGFTVESNDGLQTYNLGDLYQYFAISYCDEDVVLTVTDNDDPDCVEIFTLEPACCDCEITEPVIETIECDGGLFGLTADFFASIGTCVNYDWYVVVDGINYDLVWNPNLLALEAVGISGADEELEILLCNNSPLNECYDFLIANPCFDAPMCEITSLTANYVDGSCDGEIILLEFEFEATNFGAQGFTIEYSGGIQTFNLGDPYEIFMITLCDDIMDFVITDIEDPNCSYSIELESACCDCEISEPAFDTSNCSDNGTFDLFIDFFDNQGTCVNYEWYLTVDGEDYELEWNSNNQQYESFGLLATGALFELQLCNSSPLMECFTYTLDNPCFDAGGNCFINSFTAEYVDGSCEGEIILIEFELDATDFGANGFTIEFPDGTQTFNIGDPYEIYMITLCNENIDLVITDNDDPNCSASFDLGPACCDCEISDPIIETTECSDNGTFDLFIDFFDNQGTCVNYEWDVVVNGISYDLVWNSSNQQYEAFGLTSSDAEFELSLCNGSPLDECFVYTVENSCFVSSGTCQITTFEADYNYDNCEFEVVEVVFDFNAIDFGADGFTIESPIGIETFQIGDEYSISVLSECAEDIVITLTDVADPACTSTLNLGPACCACEFTEPTFETTDCENGVFDLFIDFEEEAGTCLVYGWDIIIDGVSYDLNYNNTIDLYEALNLTAIGASFELTLCSDSPLNECFTYILDNPCFVSSSNCTINSFTASYIDGSCAGEGIGIAFDLDATDFGANGFIVTSPDGGQAFGLGGVYELFTTSYCADDVLLTISDIDDPTCTADFILGPACCDCEIEEPTIEASACENDAFDLIIDYFLLQGSCVSYDWYVSYNGLNYDLTYNPVGQYVATGLVSTEANITFQLCNSSPLNECYTYTIANPCFVSTGNCSINSFTAEYDQSSCGGELLFINFEFDATDFGANGFTVTSSEGTIDYELGDDYVTAVISYCTDDEVVTITDNDDPSCTASFILNPACCDCEIEEPTIETTECQNDAFGIVIDYFLLEGTCVSYDWYISYNGQNYDLFWNAAGQYIASGLSSTEENITFQLCNYSPLNECWTYTIANPCYVSTGTCTINSFTAVYDEDSCNGELINILFEFDATDFGSEGFTVTSSEGTQEYEIGDDYVTSVITYCMDDEVLTITDNNDPNCTASVILNPACCDCQIENPVVGLSECENGTFDMTMNFFNYEGTCANYNWSIEVDEVEYELVWNPSIGQYDATDIVSVDVEDFDLILCNDSPLEECWTYSMMNPCYVSSNVNPIFVDIEIYYDSERNLIIDNLDDQEVKLRLFDIRGVNYQNIKLEKGQRITIANNLIPKGMFFLHTSNEKGQYATFKFVNL